MAAVVVCDVTQLPNRHAKKIENSSRNIERLRGVHKNRQSQHPPLNLSVCSLGFTEVPTMSTRASLSGSTAEQLPAELRELWNLVDGCSRPDPEKLMAAVRRVTDLVLRQGRIQSLLQDNMSSLRHQIKHLTFDLEATRRERDARPDPNDPDQFFR